MRPLVHWVKALGLVALLFVAGCDSPKEKEAKYIEHGKQLYESGDLVKATLEFKNALQINPASAAPQYYLGMIFEKQHNLQAAAGAFQRAADGDPKNFDAHKKAGQYALMAGDGVAAKGYAKDLIEISPDKPDGHTMMAAVLLLESKLDEAEAEAKTALKLDPNNIDALVVLASEKARTQQFADALGVIEQGLKTSPDSVDLLQMKLRLLFDQKQTEGVIAVLQRLHKIDPANANYVIDLANQLAATKRFDEAEAIYRQSLDAGSDSDQLISAYAAFLIRNASLDTAIDQVKSFASRTGSPAKYTLLLEQLYIRASKLDEAASLMTELQQNGKQASDRLQAQTELARIAVLKGDTQGGLDQLKTVLDQDPDNESALLLRASVRLSNGAYDEAIADTRSVLHGDINSVPALTLLSKAYVANGDADLAIDTLRNLVQLSPADVDARLQLASLLAAKSPDDALQNLDAAIALRPDAAQLKVQKAEYLIRTGRPDKAELIGQQLTQESNLAGAGHRILGEAALARSDYASAITEFKSAQDAGEAFSAFGRQIVTAYIKAGKSADAEALLDGRITTNPGDSDALILLAAMRVDSNQYGQSEDLLRRAIAAHPDQKEGYLNLAQIYNEQGKHEDAVKIADEAASRFPNDHDMLVLVGVTNDTMGKFDAAKTAYEKVLQKWPSDIVAGNNLAALIADAWPNDETLLARARSLAEKFRNSDNAVLLDTLGWVLVRQKSYDDAAIILEKATSLQPENQQMQFHYATALLAKGLKEKAKTVFARALNGAPDYRGLDDARRQAAALQ